MTTYSARFETHPAGAAFIDECAAIATAWRTRNREHLLTAAETAALQDALSARRTAAEQTLTEALAAEGLTLTEGWVTDADRDEYVYDIVAAEATA